MTDKGFLQKSEFEQKRHQNQKHSFTCELFKAKLSQKGHQNQRYDFQQCLICYMTRDFQHWHELKKKKKEIKNKTRFNTR